MATHSSILDWRILSIEEPGRLHSPWSWKESGTPHVVDLLIFLGLLKCVFSWHSNVKKYSELVTSGPQSSVLE